MGRFTEHHAFMVSEYVKQIEQQQAMIGRFTERIGEAIGPFRAARDVLVTIPGVSALVADVIIAETGTDMTVFETAAHLASWAGVCPGQNESAGKMKSSHTTHGNKYVQGALGVAALSASRSKGTFLAARYRRLVTRRGKPRSIVAIQHSILTAVWHMLRNGEAYDGLGADYYRQRDPQRTRARAIRDLEALGYEVAITPVAA